MDAGNAILGKPDPLIPPMRLQRGGTGSLRIGYKFLRYFTELGGLKTDGNVLDIGCGVGRMAIPLTSYLKDGSYEGIDITPKTIKWCQQHITPRYPNFRFQVADIYNKFYNPKGQYQPSEYRFPYEDQSFDFVLLTSVFTHLIPQDAENYLREIGRLLRPGGCVLATWFLLNDESRAHLDAGESAMPLLHPYRDDAQILSSG